MFATAAGWRQVAVPEALAALYPEGTPPPRAYRHERRLLTAFLSHDEIARGDRRWHISVRYDGRVPSWGELVQTAHDLRPGVPFAVGVPPRSWWMSVHPDVLHLWELRDEALLSQWRAERMGHEPT
jgi:hypothetical protein